MTIAFYFHIKIFISISVLADLVRSQRVIRGPYISDYNHGTYSTPIYHRRYYHKATPERFSQTNFYYPLSTGFNRFEAQPPLPLPPAPTKSNLLITNFHTDHLLYPSTLQQLTYPYRQQRERNEPQDHQEQQEQHQGIHQPHQPVYQQQYLPSFDHHHQQESDIQQQREEENFIDPSLNRTFHQPTPPANQRRNEPENDGLIKSIGYVAFDHKVLHVTNPPDDGSDYRQRRSYEEKPKNATKTNQKNKRKIGKPQTTNNQPSKNSTDSSQNYSEASKYKPKTRQIRHFHDIFMHYSGPHSVAHGHVEQQPSKFSQRFESQRRGNRYRGEVTWADAKTGGYGTQHWDLVQGKLE